MQMRMEYVLVYYGYDCRIKSQKIAYPQLDPAGVGFAVLFSFSLKCLVSLIIIIWVLSWRACMSPRRCDPNGWAGKLLGKE